MTYGPEGDNPPGYYNTVERPDPGGSLPEPPGPRARLVAKLLGAAFVLVAVGFAAVQILAIARHPSPVGMSTSLVVGRYLAVVAVAGCFGSLGVLLLRHADDPPRRLMARNTHRR